MIDNLKCAVRRVLAISVATSLARAAHRHFGGPDSTPPFPPNMYYFHHNVVTSSFIMTKIRDKFMLR